MALLHTDFYSESLGMCMQVDVILPEETHGQIGMEGKAADTYPTLYLLHGMSDDQTICSGARPLNAMPRKRASRW